jgi:hypothetical protein
MAGQPPQDASWQSSGQEQARAAWQPQDPPFEPLAETAKHPIQSHATPPPGNRGQGYPPPQHEYAAGRPEGYASGGPGYGAADQQAAWDVSGQQASWQAGQQAGQAARQPSGRAAGSAHAKGFVASLLDFGFTSFVTPKLVKALYFLAALWTGLWVLILIRLGFHYGVVAGLFMLVLVIPVYALLSLGVIRVFLELFMVLHRINENIQAIRDRNDAS